MQSLGFTSPGTFEQNRFNRQAFFQTLVMSGNAERLRQKAIEEAKKEQEELKKKADEGGIWGGITGAISGGVSGFFSGGGWGGAFVGAVAGGAQGYQTGRKTGEAGQGALMGALSGAGAGYQQKQMQEQEKKAFDLKKLELGASAIKDISKKNEAIEKEVIKLQGQGARLISDFGESKAKELPESAFIKIGSGESAQVMVKAPVKLTNENATKLNVLVQGRDDYASILSEVEGGQYSVGDVRAAATKGFGLNPRLQPVKNRLEFMVEALARGLSGAAIKEDEMDRFRSIFSIKPLDSDKEVVNKINRAVKVADRIEAAILWGATPSEKAQIVKDTLSGKFASGKLVKKETQVNKAKKSLLSKALDIFENESDEEYLERMSPPYGKLDENKIFSYGGKKYKLRY